MSATLKLKSKPEVYYPESDGKPMGETDVHRERMNYLIETLKVHFQSRSDVYVTGNIMFYYEEGEPTEVISPDVMVCFGIPKRQRTSYKTWEENDVVPSVIIEISSRGTWKKDRVGKRLLYEMLGVKEYFIFNPLDLKSGSSFMAYRLENGEYESVKIENQTVESEVLGLDLIVQNQTLRLFNPATNSFFKTTEELAEENSELKSEIERLKKLLENK